MAARLRPRHLARLVAIGSPCLAPDGERAVYVRSEVVTGEGDRPPGYRRRLHLVDIATGAERALTTGDSARAPAWSPCGRFVGFLAPPRGTSPGTKAADQLHVIAVDGGESWARTSFAAGVLAFAWDTRGERLLVTTREDWSDAASERGVGRWVDDRTHRFDGLGWLPTGPVALWRVARDENGASERRFWFDQAPDDWRLSPDGKHLVYTAPADRDEADQGMTRLWTRRAGGGRPRDLLGRAGMLGNVSVSPDGAAVAFQAPADLVTMGAPATTFVVPRRGGAARPLSNDVDTAPSVAGDTRVGSGPVRPVWLSDRALLVAVNRAGRSHLARLDVDGALEVLEDGERAVVAFAAAAGRTLALVETPTRPGVLAVRDADGAERVLVDPNAAFLAKRHVAAHERRSFVTEDGQALTYWCVHPAKPRRDGALVVQVHGGPYTNYGEGFMFEFQVLAAAGYTVVYGNPRGGSSFGAAFAGAIKGAYGTVDADDVLAIVDHASAAHDRPDAPVHLTGGSYGGFMTNWLTARVQRFRSAVTQRSICNWLSFFGTSDIGPWFTAQEQGGNPWDDTERLWDRSPLKHVANVRTPTLVIHSELDHRCPIEQGEQWFSALKVLGQAETRFLRFPDEGHDLSRSGRPDRRIERLEAIVGWFETHA